MQIYICIYRYICMELYQQQEWCLLGLRLYQAALSSSQRTWEQFPLVTSRPGQTGLSFLCFQRPRGASVRTCLEPYIAQNQLQRAEASCWERPGAHRLASRFPSRSASASSLSPLPQTSISPSTTQLTLLSLRGSHIPGPPNHLLGHRAAFTCQPGKNNSRVLKAKPPGSPQRCPFVILRH